MGTFTLINQNGSYDIPGRRFWQKLSSDYPAIAIRFQCTPSNCELDRRHVIGPGSLIDILDKECRTTTRAS